MKRPKPMNNRVKPLEPFKTLEEEAKFWDTHDLSKLFKNPKTPLKLLNKIKQ